MEEIWLDDHTLDIYKDNPNQMEALIDSGTSFLYFDPVTIDKMV